MMFCLELYENGSKNFPHTLLQSCKCSDEFYTYVIVISLDSTPIVRFDLRVLVKLWVTMKERLLDSKGNKYQWSFPRTQRRNASSKVQLGTTTCFRLLEWRSDPLNHANI